MTRATLTAALVACVTASVAQAQPAPAQFAQARPAGAQSTPAQPARAARQAPPAQGAVPAHPRDLTFKPLEFSPPEASKYRHVLANKVVAFMVEDHELPLVSVTAYIRGGAFLDPQGKQGLAAAVGSQMRAGGAGALTAEQFDEEADFLAANLMSGIGPTSGSASVNFLAKDADRALDLFFDMLRAPRFQHDRFDLMKTQQLQSIERRNDSTDDIESREWARLVRGDDHFTTRFITKASIESITRDDLVAFHKEYVHPGNLVFAVAGDFKPADMKARLEKAMAGWTAGNAAGPVPKPGHHPVPGLYLVNKEDVNQGRVTLGHLGIQRDNPDEIAVSLMNELLGGGGFTSRITNRVRSDEGLAYSAGSSFSPGTYYPGTFNASFQTKSGSVARATAIVLEEIERIRTAPVDADELQTARNYAIETFPRAFSSAAATASIFATDELTGRAPDYWRTYRDRVRAVTVADVQRVAQKYLQPDQVVILAVGHVEDMLTGDPDHPSFALEKLAPGGRVVRIPLPDPVTMEYPK